MTIIGLDAAVEDKNIGCICGVLKEGTFSITERWNGKDPLPTVIAGWMKGSAPALLAIDAPLGWPVSFRKILSTHSAGQPLAADHESFFKRKTDLNIIQRFKKRPLEISADRIARTAFFTLNRIARIEQELRSKLPLLWSVRELRGLGIIEVYPAATLLANGLSVKGYKKNNIAVRTKLLEELHRIYELQIPAGLDLIRIEHDFDALVCCLAAVDFIQEKSLSPQIIDQEIKEEGWIWVKNKD